MSAEERKSVSQAPLSPEDTALSRSARLARRTRSGTVAKADSTWAETDAPATTDGGTEAERRRPPVRGEVDSGRFFLPHPSWTLPEILDLRAATSPAEEALFDLVAERTGLVARPTRFGELRARTLDVAAALVAAGVGRGDRVVISLGRPSSFAAALLGTMRTGAVAVPVPPADGLELPRAIEERLRGVVEDCGPRAVISEGTALEIARARVPGAAVLDFASIAPGTGPAMQHARLEDIAFLQYTSGSTGRPRGVVVRHGNLVANLRAIQEAARFDEHDRCVSWLPLFHDMGLVGGLLLGLYLGTAPHLMEPRTFLLRPRSWLEAMSRFRATFTVAPNFAYALVARRIPDAALAGLDLSSVRLLFDGAEPIDRATTDAFLARLSPCGLRPEALYPVYGLAEATLAAAFPEPSTGARYDTVDRAELATSGHAVPVDPGSPGAVAVACLGRAVPGHRLWIADPSSGTALGERVVGEVMLEGPSVSPGYHGEALDRRTLRTGDLGYLAGGELHIVDRLKDLVIVGGRNHAPSDLERAAATVGDLVPGGIAAFGTRSGEGEEGTETLVIVAAVHPSSWRTAEAIRTDVAAAVHLRAGIRPTEIVLVTPDGVPRTSSGKIRRAECKARYERGELEPLEGPMARVGLKLERLRRRWAAALGARAAREETK